MKKATRPEKLSERKKRVRVLLRMLKKLFPHTLTQLQYKNEWELLVAVILSAQCTDKKVNEVTKKLFKKYTTIHAYARADTKEFEKDIFQTGFYKNKTKHVIGAAKKVIDDFGGKIPTTVREMTTIPGVGRKTAHVVLGNLFGSQEGIAVDTHVQRFSARFDLTDFPHNSTMVERDLMKIIPKKDWFAFTNLSIAYGRSIAPARRYDTTHDPLIGIFPPAGKRFRMSDFH